MKVDFELNEEHKLILRLLFETKEIEFKDFEEIYRFFKRGKWNIGGLVAFLRSSLSDTPPYLTVPKYVIPSYETYKMTVLEKEISGLQYLGLVEIIEPSYKPYTSYGNTPGMSDSTIRLSEEGIRIADRIAQGRRLILRPKSESRNTIFIAYALGKDDVNRVCEKDITPICIKLGYKPIRIDQEEPPQTITDAIMNNISKAACLIADLTYARPSVYFETGFSHGLGVPMLLTCRKDHFRNDDEILRVHFDLEQFKISYWSIYRKNIKWEKNMSPDERLKQLVPKRETD